MLAANHDQGMLRADLYPVSLKQRIAGRKVHLSHRVAERCARDVVHPGLAHLVLAHLSGACNAPAAAARTVVAAMAGSRYCGSVDVARQEENVGPFAPRLSEPGSRQVALIL